MLILEWDLEFVSTALRVPPYAAQNLFQDGRSLQPLVETRLTIEWPNVERRPSSSGPLIIHDGKRHKVRCLGRDMLTLVPSNAQGSGRRYSQTAFVSYLKEIDIFLVPDITTFPRVLIHLLPVVEVLALLHEGLLQKGRMSRTALLTYLKERDHDG